MQIVWALSDTKDGDTEAARAWSHFWRAERRRRYDVTSRYTFWKLPLTILKSLSADIEKFKERHKRSYHYREQTN